jgi:DNA-binding CsgD family transcriptional regulator
MTVAAQQRCSSTRSPSKIRHIYEKLQVHSKSEAVTTPLRNHLIKSAHLALPTLKHTY